MYIYYIMFAGSRLQLIKNKCFPKRINDKTINNMKIEKPKIQNRKLNYEYFIDMHRTVWKKY